VKQRKYPRVATCALTLAMVGCGSTDSGEGRENPPRVAVSSQQAALTAQENTEQALRGVLDAGGFLADSATLAEGLDSAFGGGGDCATITACAVNEPCDPPVETECEGDSLSVDDLEETRQELHEALDELVSFLRDEIFIDDNLESDDGTYSVYLLPESLFCDRGEGDSSTADTSGAEPLPDAELPIADELADDEISVDDDCAVDYATLQPRLRLSSPGDGDIDVDVLLTEDKSNPISLQLYHDRVGATWDLGEFKKTLESAGQELDGVETFEGKLGVELVRLGSLDYALRANVLQDVHVVGGDPGEEIEVLLAASSPTLELEFNGNDKTVSGAVNYGALNVIAPLSMFMGDDEAYDDQGNLLPPKQYTGMIDAVLGGLNASLTFDGNTDAITIENVGLGDVTSTVMHDGDEILALDVNPDDDRRFDVTVESTGDSSGTLAFSPTLDVSLAMNFANLQDQVDDIPGFMLSDTIRLWFEGNNPTIEVGEEQLEVVSGTLHLDSASEPATNVTVEAGMCLAEAPESDMEPASLAEGFAATTCQ